MCVRGGFARQDTVVSFLDLVDGVGIVVSTVTVSTVTVLSHPNGTHEVTGISPQSSTVAQLLNGFASRGTLYPPLNPILCEPSRSHSTVVSMM